MHLRELPANVRASPDVILGDGVRFGPFVNLYGCSVGDASQIGAFVEVQRDVHIGKRCKISSHSFVCSGVTIEDEVFIGHGVMFINDRHPRATNADGSSKKPDDWMLERTYVRHGASVGSGAIIMCGVEIGAGAMVAAGALVTSDVPARATVMGMPARIYSSCRPA